MDSKVIVLLVFILFAIVVSFMVGNGMIDLTSIYERVTKSQAEQGLGGVKLQIVSPVPSVYYEAVKGTNDAVYHLDLGKGADGDILQIAGKNLDGKTLTISVASPHWYVAKDITDWTQAPPKTKTVQSEISAVNDDFQLANDIAIWRDTGAPFQMPEFVELVFAVGETAKAEVTIVVEPSA